ncbi:MAG: alpha/beta hydrolase [Chloroflexota bacterium]
MPTIAVNGVDLYYEETGSGTPLVFVHEFAGDYRSWAPQVRFFSRRYRVITYNARGYPPSSVPTDGAVYSEEQNIEDLHALIRGLGLGRAHICGLSMGGNVTLKMGLSHPDVCRSLVVAGAGYGSTNRETFQRDVGEVAARFEREGAEVFGEEYARGSSRARFIQKDPHGWEEFKEQLKQHSSLGSALTQRGVQAKRTPLVDLGADLARITTPTLVINGDEDDLCLEAGLVLKRAMPNCALAVFPNCGHTLNLEEPALFNQMVLDFLTTVDAGRWQGRTRTDTSLLSERR